MAAPSSTDRIPVRAACIYCRLSYAPDGSMEKVERQEADCRALAERLGWPVCCVYSDNSRSAWQRNRKRPEWDKMLASLEPDASHRHDAIVVYHGDRLIRQPWDLELLLNLAHDRHLPLASVSGTRDLSNEDDRYILRIEAAGFCRASADTARRVRGGWRARAERGMPLGGGGRRPFGYGVPTGRTGTTGKPVYDTTKIVPAEAEVLREAVRRLLAGETQGSVIRYMNSVSTTTEGNEWTGRGLRHLLVNPRIAGLISHEGQLLPAVWEPIISREDWEAVKMAMAAKAREFPYRGRGRRWLLAGIATCSGCGRTMRTKPTGGRNRKDSRLYHCWSRACPAPVARNQEHLDAYVTGRVLRRLQDPDLLGEILGPEPGVSAEIAALERRKEEARHQLENLVDLPDLDVGLIAKALAGFDKRIAELKTRHAETSRQRLLARMAGITKEQWDATPIDVQAETVRALYQVEVLPATWRGPGFDPASVRLIPVK